MEGIVFLAIIIVVVVVIIKKKNEGTNVTGGSYDAELTRLEGFYSTIRQNLNNLGGGVISVNTYFFMLNGRVDSSSAFLSVGVRNVTNTALAQQLGMEVANLNGEIECRFVLRKKFSTSTKRVILSELGGRLAEKYPNDVLKYDNSIPALLCMVDVKNIMDMMGK